MGAVSVVFARLDLVGMVGSLTGQDPTLSARLVRVDGEVGIASVPVWQPHVEAE
jgi:hypothetical protein